MYQLTGNVNIINAEQTRKKKSLKNKPKTERHVIQYNLVFSLWWLPSLNSTFSEFICKVQPYKLAQQRKHNRIIADWLYVPHDSCAIALHLSHTVNQTAPNRVDLFQGICARLQNANLNLLLTKDIILLLSLTNAKEVFQEAFWDFSLPDKDASL